MAIAKTIKQYLDSKHIIYSVVDVSRFETPMQAASLANISPRALYYAEVVRDAFGLMLAVLPASHRLDYEQLSRLFGRKASPAYPTQLSAVFVDCEAHHIPPVGAAYGLRSVVDVALSTPEDVYILVGDQNRLIKLSRRDFMSLQSDALLASDFAVEIDAESPDVSESAELGWTKAKIRQRVEQSGEFPPMPEMATRIFALRANPDAEIADLASLIEQDPSLTAQVMRYANSPYFGFQGRIDTLQTAIARVLGFDMVMNLALGLAVAKPFKMPRQGPLGLDHYWHQAVYSASLMQMLAKEMPAAQRPRPGLCYLVGLLHDFGFLVLGHLFRDEFDSLSAQVAEHGRDKLDELERDLLDVTHGELGSWIFKAWGLPDTLVVATQEQHNEDYVGEHEVYVSLIRLADNLLQSYEAGEVLDDQLPQDLLDALGLEPKQVIKVMAELIGHDNHLNDLVRQLAA